MSIRIILFRAIVIVLSTLIFSCAVLPSYIEGSQDISDRQQLLLQSAKKIVRTQNLTVNGYRYSNDCTGAILAIYAHAGIRLEDLFSEYTGNGVTRLYKMSQDHNLLYDTIYPSPGDLIFWDNTYDRQNDKKWNDPLTHIGMVTHVDEEGQIEYLHYNYKQGIVLAQMNLRNPNVHINSEGVVVNSPMRMSSHRYLNPDQWLSSHLYRTLAALYLIQS